MLADGMGGNTDHFCSDAGFPAHAEGNPAAAGQIGDQGRQVNVADPFRQADGKYPGHLQKFWICTLQSGDGIDIQDGKYHQKRNENGEIFRTDPDQGQNDKGSHRNGFDQENHRFQDIAQKPELESKTADQNSGYKCHTKAQADFAKGPSNGAPEVRFRNQ